MDHELRSGLRYVLSTGDLPLDYPEQVHALIRICQERIAYLNRGQGYYLYPASDPDRVGMWFVSASPDTWQPPPIFPGYTQKDAGPYEMEVAKAAAQRLNERQAIRVGPLSDTPGMHGVFHRVGCIRDDGALSHFRSGPRCEYCAVGPNESHGSRRNPAGGLRHEYW